MALRNYTSDLVYIALVFVAPIIVNQLKSDFQGQKKYMLDVLSVHISNPNDEGQLVIVIIQLQ